MSNIATPRTDGLSIVMARSGDTLRTAIATLALGIIWLSFQPFQGSSLIRAINNSSENLINGGAGNLINQIGFTALFAIVVFSVLSLAPKAAVVRLLSFTWMAAIAMLAVSVVFAPDPNVAIRGFLFTTLCILSAAGVCVLPKSADSLCHAILVAGAAVLTLSYVGLVVVPELAIHPLDSPNVGAWRGVYAHKNTAGPVMAIFTFAGVYMWRRGMRMWGLFFSIAAFIFAYKTGSKTSLALIPLVIFMVLIPAVLGMRLLGALIVTSAILGMHALTIGTVYVPFLDDILRTFSPTTTFTGRTYIWLFAKEYVMHNPLTGFGFDGFWQTPTALEAESAFDQVWHPASTGSGHNAFLDVALSFGLLSLGLASWLFVFAPAIAYAKTVRATENAYLADFFYMIIAFTGMNAALESFYFERAHPVWLTLVIAAFGLRLTSRFKVMSR